MITRVLVVAVLIATVLCRPANASGGCDSLRFFSFHVAERTAWTNRDYPRLQDLNIEESEYADACGHRETGADRERDLEQALQHYRDAAVVELGHHKYGLAKKHLLRSNAIIRELQVRGDSPRPDYLKATMAINQVSLASIPANAK